MSERGAKLKHPTGWFAAGREVARALRMLSDGAFKVYIHLCLTADRSTGRIATGHADLVEALGKSRRSVISYLEELRREGVCKVQCAVNQHAGGEIEICDPFWPYERAPIAGELATLEGYVEGIRRLLKPWRCIQVSISPADQKIAAALFARGVPLDQIERGITLACARKYVALCNAGDAGAITSFGYFQNAIEEAATQKVSDDYWRYLRHRAGRLELEWVGKMGGSGRQANPGTA
jgi:hypothetical protein